MRTLNVLVVGSGMYVSGRGTKGFGTVLPALFRAKRMGLVDKVIIASKNPRGRQELWEKINALSNKMGVELNVDFFPKGDRENHLAYQEAISALPRPACAIVAVPDHLHTEIAGYLIKSKIHPLVVKPLASTLSEVKYLIDLIEANGVYGAVEFHKRLDLANLKLLDTLREKKIGDPLYFLVEYSQRKVIPEVVFSEWVSKTNIFQYLGVHYVDLIYFATRAYPKRVLGIAQASYLRQHGIDTYDAIQAIVEWQDVQSGHTFTSVILTNWIDPNLTSAMSDQKIKVIGTKGRFESDQKNRGIQIVSEAEGIEDVNPYFSDFYWDVNENYREFSGYGAKSILQFLQDVAEIVAGKRKAGELKGLRPTFYDALISTSVIEAVNQSLQKDNQWIPIAKYLNSKS